jgi:hypothetical protein
MFDNYTVLDALAFAIEIHEQQGFVKSGHGTVRIADDGETEIRIFDNKTCILEKIKSEKIPESKYMDQAKEMLDRINGKLMLKKLTSSSNSFENSLIKALNEDLNKFAVSLIASMPNSIVIDQKREMLNDKMSKIKHTSQYFGKKGTRYDIDVDVLDVKYIQSSDVFMITTVYNKENIIKFWWREQPDISDIINEKTISIRGTVKAHELSKFSGAKETLINRVKITNTK